MSLNPTSLFIQMAQIPATFVGTPNDLATEMVKRMRIVSPNGTNFIFIGDVEPTSNVGPWLKGGTQWWVWDDATKRYVPLDISASFTIPFFQGLSTPGSSTPPVWLKTSKDPTDVDPSVGDPIGWYVFNGTSWVPYNSIVLSGPTANRPTGAIEYQQYYDTSISCLIWWERSQWRTVSGVPGDVKFVAFDLLSGALTANPGWALFGEANQSFRGRILVQAAQDAEQTLTVDANVPVHAPFTTLQSPPFVKVDNTSTLVYPPELFLWCITKL